MSIVIYGDLFTFPDGSAATNRVYSYAKGFMENGINVHVICLYNEYLDQSEGEVNGIKYYIPLRQKKRNKYFVIRSWQKLKKYWNTFLIIKKINYEDKIIAINSWSSLIFTHLYGKCLSKFTNSKFIIECSEHPLRSYQNGNLRKKLGEVIFNIESSISDGIFCISHFLIDFYKSNGIDNRKLFLVPSTVDPGRFKERGNKPVDYKYIGYFGSLTFTRDRVDLLLNAYAAFSKQNPDFRLIIGGFCTEDEKADILNLINKLGIESKVLLLEYLSREEILRYVINAEILVMVRSNDLQSQASYPSKLTEFLATSIPVITVNVGEISLYLKDGIHAFFVEPDNSGLLAEKLDFICKNPEIAFKVGQNGKQLTETIFNYNYQAKRMIEFISSLNFKEIKVINEYQEKILSNDIK